MAVVRRTGTRSGSSVKRILGLEQGASVAEWCGEDVRT